MNDSITCTNGDLWFATQRDAEGSSAFTRITAVPMKALAVTNRSALIRAVQTKLADIEAARVALCEEHGTKREDGSQYDIKDPEAFQAEFVKLLEQPCVLKDVLPMKIADLLPTAFLSAPDVAQCGPLLID